MEKTVEQRLIELEAWRKKTEKNRSDINWAEQKVLEAARKLIRMKNGGYYLEDGVRCTLGHNERKSYTEMMTGNLMVAIEELGKAGLDSGLD